MSNELIIVIISAFGGGLITIVVTYLNNKAKRFELEYNYRRKLEEKYLANAQKHLNDVYIPLYSKLMAFQNTWNSSEAKNLNNFQTLKNEISKLKNFKKDLEKSGLTAFLIIDIEESFDHLLYFLSKSQDANKARYGIITRYNILGREVSLYRPLSKGFGRKTINFYKIIAIIQNIIQHLSLTRIMGLYDYEFEIILDSAPFNSKDFDNQLSKFLRDIKEKIKNITLGTI